jgi:hypothetical protein
MRRTTHVYYISQFTRLGRRNAIDRQFVGKHKKGGRASESEETADDLKITFYV